LALVHSSFSAGDCNHLSMFDSQLNRKDSQLVRGLNSASQGFVWFHYGVGFQRHMPRWVQAGFRGWTVTSV